MTALTDSAKLMSIKLIKCQTQASSPRKLLTRFEYLNKKEHYSKTGVKPRCASCDYTQAVFIFSKQQGIYITLKEDMTYKNSDWLFALHVTRSTLERLEKEKQGFEFIDSTSINLISTTEM